MTREKKILRFGRMFLLLFPFVTLAAISEGRSKLALMHPLSSVRPLDSVTVISQPGGTLSVRDSRGREYDRERSAGTVTFCAGGALGRQTVTFFDSHGRATDSAAFRVEAQTEITDGGKISELFGMLREGMMVYSPKGYEEITWNGKPYRYFVNWVLDNNNTMKGMQYFSPWGGDLVDLFREAQKSDGMIWSFVNTQERDSYYYETAYTPLGYFRRDPDAWFVRQPVENHVEYNFVNMMYQFWKSSGNDVWMQRNLDCACRALDYSVTDSLRWSKRMKLLKRPYCIDSWDFQVDDQYTPAAPLSPTMVVVPGKTKFGIFFGDNTGYYEACNQLAEMLAHAGQAAKAASFSQRGKEILDRLVALSWNGGYFTHFIDEDSTLRRDLGVDEKSQIAQGNMYSLNRGLPRDMNIAIIKTYLKLRTQLPPGSPGEWYAIYPPFERGFALHDARWQYMNGGVAGHAIGELARGAYENGFEEYASATMFRMLELMKEHGNRLYFSYTGSVPPPPPKPAFRALDVSAEANMDLWDKGSANVFTWMDAGISSGNDMRGLPTGDQIFHGIPFHVVDPEGNGRRSVVAVSTKPGFPRVVEIPVHDTASSVYLLHSSSDNIPAHVAGAITFVYSDGTESSQYLMKGTDVTNWWFSSLDEERSGVAWSGPNPRSAKVGVCWAVIDNPNPHKEIVKLLFHAPLEGGIYALIALTLADRPFYTAPKAESYGGPDNWAAATGMAALVEGLAGVKNQGLAFSSVELSPRWASAGIDSTNVTVLFPSSNGYVAYRYRHQAEKKRFDLRVTGSGDEIRAHLLLPEGLKVVSSVSSGGRPVPHSESWIGESHYLDFALPLPAVQSVTISYL
ncbi:MAG TPA: hypothetical protein VL126_04435 [Bacteroidota bacterium]|nr:hypothetical protein [Bacteroidota bacterium]